MKNIHQDDVDDNKVLNTVYLYYFSQIYFWSLFEYLCNQMQRNTQKLP